MCQQREAGRAAADVREWRLQIFDGRHAVDHDSLLSQREFRDMQPRLVIGAVNVATEVREAEVREAGDVGDGVRSSWPSDVERKTLDRMRAHVETMEADPLNRDVPLDELVKLTGELRRLHQLCREWRFARRQIAEAERAGVGHQMVMAFVAVERESARKLMDGAIGYAQTIED